MKLKITAPPPSRPLRAAAPEPAAVPEAPTPDVPTWDAEPPDLATPASELPPFDTAPPEARPRRAPAPGERLYVREGVASPPGSRFGGTGRGGLHKVLERERRETKRVWSPGAATRLLPVHPVAGGVGCTTIMATLARVSSILGEDIALVDGDPDSQLGFFFGGDIPPDGFCSFLPEQGATEGAVHILAGVDGDRREGRSEASRGESGERQLWRKLAQFDEELDRILINTWPGMPERTQRRVLAGGICLAVLVPDLRCLIAVGRLLRFFAGREQILGRSLRPYFLLNRFDRKIPFHLEIRDELRRQLGDRLLPLELPESDSVRDAVVEGMTVVDFAPNGEAADCFFDLSDRIRCLTPAANYSLSETDRW